MHLIFSDENIPSGKFWVIRFRILLLSLYILFLGTFYQYERTFIYDLHYHIYDGAYLGADLSDEI